ncbi:MAG TPA: hypothetical protein VJ731_02370 [Terriglobales bacterium]|nr:hypothetical protein [Terriglobales bacterium]
MAQQMDKRWAGYTERDWLWIGLAAATLVPLVAVRFLNLASDSAFAMAAATGLAIVAAAFCLSWGVEGLETVMPQGAALAILALIEVAPEYSFEVILAYRQQTTLAAASMTGANRLLLGFGWPLLMFTAYLSARRKGQRYSEIQLGREQLGQIVFLLVASLYAFVIVVKRSISLIDSAILILIYGFYIFASLRIGGEKCKEDEEEEQREVGVAARTKQLPGLGKSIAIGMFLAFGAFVLYVGAEPFIDAILGIARSIGVSEFILIQWVAPFLSEFPESVTAYIWAASVVAAAMGLSNLISSKLNQWTLLIAAIPIAYSLGGGRLQVLHFDAQVRDEIFITAAQSLFGSVLLLTMRFNLKKAIVLLVLFLIQFFIPSESVRLVLAEIYLILTALYVAARWRTFNLQELRNGFLPRGSQSGEA